MDANEIERARKLHQEAIVIDTLGSDPVVWSENTANALDKMIQANIPTSQIFPRFDELLVRDLITNKTIRAEYAQRFRESGVTGTSCTIGPFGRIIFSYENAVRDLSLWTAKFDALSDVLKKATCAKDIEDAKKEGKHAIILNFQNTTHIGQDLEKLQFFYDFGIRIIQLTYNNRNLVGDGCTERTNAGLSNFGIQVIEKMNELGILVDVAHTGAQTVADALDISKEPIAFTHTCCRTVYKHDRGKTDEQLQAIAEKGGYIGIVNVPFFITQDPNPTLSHMMDQIDHLVDLVGVDYAGIGTDWPTTAPKPFKDLFNEEVRKIGFRPEHRVDAHAVTEGFERQDQWPNITAALVGRGYSDQEVQKIIGGNFLRLFRKVVG